MKKSEILSELEAGREELLDLLEEIPDEDFFVPGVSGDWTLKDLIVHLTLWEAQLITLLFRAKTMPRPNTAHFAAESTDELNARWRLEHKDRPLERVMADFEGIRPQTIRRVQDYTEQELNDPARFEWLDGEPLWQWIAEETFQHERDHIREIQTWRSTRVGH